MEFVSNDIGHFKLDGFCVWIGSVDFGFKYSQLLKIPVIESKFEYWVSWMQRVRNFGL